METFGHVHSYILTRLDKEVEDLDDSSIPEPTKKIANDFIKARRLSDLIADIVGLIIFGVLFYIDFYFQWAEWIGWVLLAILGISFVGAVWGYGIEPVLLQKSWRYDVSSAFIQLKHGIWFVTHQVIPMTKVQSVELNQGPILRKFGLYSIKIGTMGTKHKIPGLPEGEAKQLRDTIAHYAKLKEVEESNSDKKTSSILHPFW